jgi:two-component system, NarL family, nitrate/nitrite response regulator NarL
MLVYLISTVTLHREGLAEVLGRREGIEVVGTSAELDSAPLTVTAAPGAERTIIVLDVAGLDAADVAARVARRSRARVLAINVPARERDVIACAEAGVACCLTVEASIDDLVAAVAAVARGEAPCSPWTGAVLLRRVASLARERRTPVTPAAPEPVLAQLTVRELEIVELVDRGLSNKEIARELCIELPTVKNHVHRVLDKLGVRRRADAAAVLRRDRAGGDGHQPGPGRAVPAGLALKA